ncbi:MAG: nuclear transport factor 2 family protein [Bacteroidales bacterium]|nr:nuclear transport factor 2 family protein [Bacteroidales bacterium]
MQNIIEKFYKAFAILDVETMLSCYHPDIVFSDPAFGKLSGDKARNMWRMLCHSQKKENFIINWSAINFDERAGTVKWEAFYTFKNTGRKVHNIISAKFKFKDGLIIEHIDNFNIGHWAKQALGFKGYLFGGTYFFKKKLQASTNRLLNKFENSILRK